MRCQHCPQPTGCGDSCRFLGYEDLTHASEVDVDDLEVRDMLEMEADARAFLEDEDEW